MHHYSHGVTEDGSHWILLSDNHGDRIVSVTIESDLVVVENDPSIPVRILPLAERRDNGLR